MSDDEQNVINVEASQYRDSRNLKSRGHFHARYSKVDWFKWVGERVTLPEGAHILDVGCGPGSFWRSIDPQPASVMRLVLSDRSKGMIGEAARTTTSLQEAMEVLFCVADAEALPFNAGSFDAVFAMHMLYHMPKPEQAIRAMAKLLRPGGALYVTTNGAVHMDAINQLRQQIFGGDALDFGAACFGLTQAEQLLHSVLGNAKTIVLRDTYEVSSAEDILHYLLSMPPANHAPDHKITALKAAIDQKFDASGGQLCVSRDTGLVKAVLPT